MTELPTFYRRTPAGAWTPMRGAPGPGDRALPPAHARYAPPWDTSPGFRDHDRAAAAAVRIARDYLGHGRTGEQHAYDPQTGEHKGSTEVDQIRAHDEYLTVWCPAPKGDPDELAEGVYLRLFPVAARFSDLCDEIARLAQAGLIEADEPAEVAAARLLDRGYDPEKLRREVGADPVGLEEIAARLRVKRGTVDQWRTRGVLPEATWTVGGRPAWPWAVIEAWARETGRWTAESEQES